MAAQTGGSPIPDRGLEVVGGTAPAGFAQGRLWSSPVPVDGAGADGKREKAWHIPSH